MVLEERISGDYHCRQGPLVFKVIKRVLNLLRRGGPKNRPPRRICSVPGARLGHAHVACQIQALQELGWADGRNVRVSTEKPQLKQPRGALA
jgi:hypothetical protein